MFHFVMHIFEHAGTEATGQLSDLLEDKALIKDIQKMSTTSQTYALEAFHSLLNQYAPKSRAYSNLGILTKWVHDLVLVKSMSDADG